MIESQRAPALVPINRDGWPFIVGFAVVAALLWSFSNLLGVVGLVATLWCVWFFRDPERLTPVRGGLIISPADGVVCAVTTAAPPSDLGLSDAPLTRISIFLNIFNVHVNRIPIDGTIGAVRYRSGKFVNASLDKASDDNERNALRIDTAAGPAIVVVHTELETAAGAYFVGAASLRAPRWMFEAGVPADGTSMVHLRVPLSG